MFKCPICNKLVLENPPKDKYNNPSYEVCSSCGFEFGVDDDNYTYEEWREKWIARGRVPPWANG